MAQAFITLQTLLCGGMAAALLIGIPAALIFGCPPAGVPFKGYYSGRTENRVNAWIGLK